MEPSTVGTTAIGASGPAITEASGTFSIQQQAKVPATTQGVIGLVSDSGQQMPAEASGGYEKPILMSKPVAMARISGQEMPPEVSGGYERPMQMSKMSTLGQEMPIQDSGQMITKVGSAYNVSQHIKPFGDSMASMTAAITEVTTKLRAIPAPSIDFSAPIAKVSSAMDGFANALTSLTQKLEGILPGAAASAYSSEGSNTPVTENSEQEGGARRRARKTRRRRGGRRQGTRRH